MAKKYTNILLITVNSLPERDCQRFGLNIFLKCGYFVKILDIQPLFTSNPADIVLPATDDHKFYKLILNSDEFCLELNKHSSDNCLIIMNCPIVYWGLSIYRIMKKRSIDYVYINLSNMPSLSPNIGNSRVLSYAKFIRYLKLISVRAVCDKLISLLPCKYYWMLGITPAKYYLVGGLTSLKPAPNAYISKETTVITAHSMDYDRYLDMEVSKPDVLNKYTKFCVFIDQYLPYHPDYANTGEKSPVSGDKYYSALNNFFDYIEKKFNLTVIIAAHPRSNYNLHPNAFPNRTIISGKTNYLVRDADFVIMHSSTAISYAVLFKKAILFITTDDMKEKNGSVLYDGIYSFAQYFGQTPINIDDDYSSLCVIPNIDENIYEKYINDYIKIKNTPNKKIWEIFIDEIEKE